MSRLHIFDILTQEIDFSKEYDKLFLLLKESISFQNNRSQTCTFSIFDYIEQKFRNWKLRGTYISFDALMKDIGHKSDKFDVKFFLLSELLMNLITNEVITATTSYDSVNSFITSQLICIMGNISQVLEQTGYFFETIEDRLYILEKRAEAIAVTEIMNDYQVLEYNHFALRGDLSKKMAIINHLYKTFESKRKVLENAGYKSLCDDYAFLANTFSRHNSDDSLKTLESGKTDVEKALDYAYDLYLTVILIDNYLNIIKEPVNLLKQSLKPQK